MCIDPLGKALVFSRCPAAFELSTVLAFFVEFEVVVIFEARKFRVTDRVFGQDCRDEDHSVRLCENKVSWQHHRSPDTNRRVDRSQFHLRPGRRIIPFVESVEVWDFPILLLVSYAGIEDKPGMGVGGDAVAQVGTDQRAFNDLSKAIGHVHVPKLQLIDRPTIISTDPAFCLAFRGNGLGHVCPSRHILSGERTAGKRLFDVESLPVALKLVGVSLLAEKTPDVLDGAVEGPLDQIVGNLRAAIRETIALPVRRIEHHLIFCHLYLREGSRSSHHRPHDYCRHNCLFHESLLPRNTKSCEGCRQPRYALTFSGSLLFPLFSARTNTSKRIGAGASAPRS